ncbi:hypothetical protein LPB137_02910 [Poseidonibacter parvus]|uniref:Uncharacterized protein n=1 Tax=Poseidonibacter parvus TaxID=1850254 RepID=A0A1P8KJY8_9BACT|nr:SHOCT domain-containing protein [Poseidonibacter parvus]APW64869.1 hypothetical protein LPB137_02910 [Poseidonibacter parvus]
MQTLTQEGQNLVNNLSNKYNLSADAIIHMIGAVNTGGGTMAQFNSPELGGSGQWMQGGMTMVGDMFNNGLKNTVDNLCSEISNALLSVQVFPVIEAGTPGSNQWWPKELGVPFSSGSQNNTRYAVFPNRLAVEVNSEVTVYDTLDNNIGGVSQQQGGDNSLTFSSQYGTISVSSLPIISGGNIPSMQNNDFSQTPQTNFIEPSAVIEEAPIPNSTKNESSNEIIEMIEQLGRLHQAGILSDNEFNTKKNELLSRL